MEDSNTATRKPFAVPADVRPREAYDGPRGRTCAGLAWLLARAYGSAGKILVLALVPILVLALVLGLHSPVPEHFIDPLASLL